MFVCLSVSFKTEADFAYHLVYISNCRCCPGVQELKRKAVLDHSIQPILISIFKDPVELKVLKSHSGFFVLCMVLFLVLPTPRPFGNPWTMLVCVPWGRGYAADRVEKCTDHAQITQNGNGSGEFVWSSQSFSEHETGLLQ